MKLAKQKDEERTLAITEDRADALPFLHGIPCSVKELYAIKGLLSTVGVAMLNKPR